MAASASATVEKRISGKPLLWMAASTRPKRSRNTLHTPTVQFLHLTTMPSDGARELVGSADLVADARVNRDTSVMLSTVTLLTAGTGSAQTSVAASVTGGWTAAAAPAGTSFVADTATDVGGDCDRKGDTECDVVCDGLRDMRKREVKRTYEKW